MTETLEKPLFKLDESTCSNDALWKNIREELPNKNEPYDVSGMIVEIAKRGVVLYVPICGVYKVFVRNKYLRGSPFENPRLGQWMSVHAYERMPRADDDLHVPLFSHLAASQPVEFFPEQHLEGWEQRHFAGTYEFLLTVDLAKQGNVVMSIAPKKPTYRVISEYGIEAFVPTHRLDPILMQHMTAPRKIRFWATRANYVEEMAGTDKNGIALYLVDFNPIDEILPDGHIQNLGCGKRISCADDNTTNEVIAEKRVDSIPKAPLYPPLDAVVSTTAVAKPSKPAKGIEEKRVDGIPKDTLDAVVSATTVVKPTVAKDLSGENVVDVLEAFKNPYIQKPMVEIAERVYDIPKDTLDAAVESDAVVVKPSEANEPSREDIVVALEAFKIPQIWEAVEQEGLQSEVAYLLRWQEWLKKKADSSSN